MDNDDVVLSAPLFATMEEGETRALLASMTKIELARGDVLFTEGQPGDRLYVNVLGGPILGGVFFPTPTWIVIVVALAPLVAFLATSLIVAVSGRSTTVQGAQGATVLVILPVVALVVGQASGLLLFDMSVALIGAGRPRLAGTVRDHHHRLGGKPQQIGRASCRERV